MISLEKYTISTSKQDLQYQCYNQIYEITAIVVKRIVAVKRDRKNRDVALTK